MKASGENPPVPGLSAGGLAVSTPVILIIAGIMALAIAACEPGPSWLIGKDVERKMEMFPWATRECIEKEIGNPNYRNNDEKLRLCMLEARVAGLEARNAPDN